MGCANRKNFTKGAATLVLTKYFPFVKGTVLRDQIDIKNGTGRSTIPLDRSYKYGTTHDGHANYLKCSKILSYRQIDTGTC